MTQAPAFSRGGDAAQQMEEELSASRGSNFRRTEYLPNIGKGNTIFVRYLTDSPDWYHTLMHTSAPTKAAPSDWPKERKWPESLPAICRYDKAFKAMYSDCYICDAQLVNKWGKVSKPVLRVWALAVIREEVIGTPDMVEKGWISQEQVGKRVGFKDATREVEETDEDGKPTGKKTIEPRIVVVNKAMNNYFTGLNSMFGIYGTVCDRDYALKQVGENKDVEFQHIPLDPTPTHKPGTESWAAYDEAIKTQGLDLVTIMSDKASDDFYAKFFDPTKEAPKRESKNSDGSESKGQGAPAAQQQASPSNEPDADRLAAMRARIRGGGAEPQQSEPQSSQQPEAAGMRNF